MERLCRWMHGAFLTVCHGAQYNHLIFLVHTHFAGVMFGWWLSHLASTKYMWGSTAQLSRLLDLCRFQLEMFLSIVTICLLWAAVGFRWTQWWDNILKWCTPCGKWYWPAGKQCADVRASSFINQSAKTGRTWLYFKWLILFLCLVLVQLVGLLFAKLQDKIKPNQCGITFPRVRLGINLSPMLHHEQDSRRVRHN